MAISENRLTERNLVSLVTNDFIGSTDTGEDQPSNKPKENNDVEKPAESKTNKAAQEVGKASVFDKSIGNGIEDLLGSNSIVNAISNLESVICNLSVVDGKVKRLPENRDFDKYNISKTNTTPCDIDNLDFSLDSFLSMGGLFSGVTAVISDSGLHLLEQLIDKEFAGLSGFSSGLAKAFKAGNKVMDIMSSVVGLLNTIGGTLNQKINIINPAICDMTLPTYEIGDLPFLKKFVIGLALNLSDCANLDKLLDFTNKLLGNGTIGKGEVLSTIMSTFKDVDGDSAIRKIKLLSAIISTDVDLTDKDAILTKGKTKIILDSIAESKNVTNSPISEYVDLTEALDKTDSSWNKDKEGNTDYSSIKDNKYLSVLASKSTESMSEFNGAPVIDPINDLITATLTITGDYTDNFTIGEVLTFGSATARVISVSLVDGNTIIVMGSLLGDILAEGIEPLTADFTVTGDQTADFTVGSTVEFSTGTGRIISVTLVDGNTVIVMEILTGALEEGATINGHSVTNLIITGGFNGLPSQPLTVEKSIRSDLLDIVITTALSEEQIDEIAISCSTVSDGHNARIIDYINV